MVDSKLTTIVIPNYNGIRYIEACISSIMEGTRQPHIIVVDNASSDGSRELIEEKFPSVELIRLLENTGFAYAVNVGIKHVKTTYVFLLNNDTRIDKNCVEQLEEAMERSKEIFSLSAKMLNLWEPEKVDDAGDFYSALGWAFTRGKDQPERKFQKRYRIFSACAGAAIYRIEYLQKTGLFDEAHFAYLEDVDLGYRANLKGYKSFFEPKAVVYHAGSGASGSRHNPFKVDLSARNSIYLIGKNMPFLQILLNLPFLLIGFAMKTLFFVRKGMGVVYLKGLLKGFFLAFSKEGRQKKVTFSISSLKNYIWIQGQLWINMVRRLL